MEPARDRTAQPPWGHLDCSPESPSRSTPSGLPLGWGRPRAACRRRPPPNSYPRLKIAPPKDEPPSKVA
eukprot:1983700-Pyramimonas_sp.AAC.1